MERKIWLSKGQIISKFWHGIILKQSYLENKNPLRDIVQRIFMWGGAALTFLNRLPEPPC